MKIEQGQIWKDVTLGGKFVISVSTDRYIHCIYDNGCTKKLNPMMVRPLWNSEFELVTTFSSWREALVSEYMI